MINTKCIIMVINLILFSVNPIFKSIDLSKASVNDVDYLKNIKQQFNNCTIIADKAYVNSDYQLNLFESYNIKLDVNIKLNQENYKKTGLHFPKNKKTNRKVDSTPKCDTFIEKVFRFLKH